MPHRARHEHRTRQTPSIIRIIFYSKGRTISAPSITIKNKKTTKDMKQIHTDNAPAAIGPYSQAIEANGFIFASGQLPIDPQTGAFAEGGIKGQTRQSLLNAQSILRAAGAELSNVVKTTVFLDSMDDFAAMNEVYAEFFSQPYPARSAVSVKKLPKGALVEIEVIAAK